MSLVGTLGRIAVGIAVAKGVGGLMNRRGGGGAGGGLGGLLGGALGGAQRQAPQMGGQSGGGLGGALGGALGGGGLGNLGSLLGGAAGGGTPASGGLGGLLESISGGAAGGNAQIGGAANEVKPPVGGSLGDLLNSALQGKQIPQPEPAQEDQARILIQAMVNAAKSDGDIDTEEQQKIVEHLGDEVSDEERQFVISEMKSPLNTDAFIRSIPKGAEMQVYMMSILGINLDSREEAVYLDTLRKGIGMSEQQCNAIHDKLGVPTMYS